MTNLSSIAPCFIVTDVKPSVTFYVEKLGFKVLFQAPEEDPFFAMVGRDDIFIMLKAVAQDVKPIPNKTRHEWAPWDAYISTKNPETLFKEYTANGVGFRRPLEVNSDKLLGFEVE